ncbi:hypothetical protein [Nostoc sp.]
MGLPIYSFLPGSVGRPYDSDRSFNEVGEEGEVLTILLDQYAVGSYNYVLIFHGLKTIIEETENEGISRLVLNDYDRFEFRFYNHYGLPNEKLVGEKVFTEGEVKFENFLTNKERGLDTERFGEL